MAPITILSGTVLNVLIISPLELYEFISQCDYYTLKMSEH